MLSHRLWGKGAAHRDNMNVAIDTLIAGRAPIIGRPIVQA